MVTIVRRSHAFAALLVAGLLGASLPAPAAEAPTSTETTSAQPEPPSAGDTPIPSQSHSTQNS